MLITASVRTNSSSKNKTQCISPPSLDELGCHLNNIRCFEGDLSNPLALQISCNGSPTYPSLSTETNNLIVDILQHYVGNTIYSCEFYLGLESKLILSYWIFNLRNIPCPQIHGPLVVKFPFSLRGVWCKKDLQPNSTRTNFWGNSYPYCWNLPFNLPFTNKVAWSIGGPHNTDTMIFLEYGNLRVVQLIC